MLCTALGVDGFFTAPAADPVDPLTFRLVGSAGAEQHRPVNAELRVLDRTGVPIGAYFLGAATITGDTVTALPASRPHPLAGEIWNRWRAGRPTARNRWAGYPTDGRRAWLEVVRLHSALHRPSTSTGPVEVDGAHATDPPGIHCAIGEAVNGPGGYFGAGLDALRDCLRGGFGITVPFSLVWNDIDVARGPYLEQVLGILTDAGVRVELRPAPRSR